MMKTQKRKQVTYWKRSERKRSEMRDVVGEEPKEEEEEEESSPLSPESVLLCSDARRC